MPRERLPDDRAGATMHFTILARENEQPDGSADVREIKGYVTANTYPDGRLGEIFVRVGKAGSTDAWIDAWALSCSIALQHGATVDELFGKFKAMDFPPAGAVKWVDGVKRCSSVPDLVARWVLSKFGNTSDEPT